MTVLSPGIERFCNFPHTLGARVRLLDDESNCVQFPPRSQPTASYSQPPPPSVEPSGVLEGSCTETCERDHGPKLLFLSILY